MKLRYLKEKVVKSMTIRFLDAYTNNPGDLSFKAFEDLGDFMAFDRTDFSQLKERAENAEVVIVNKFPVNHETLACMNKVQYICVAATGYNNIDLNATKSKNIVVSNVKGYSVHSVAQHVFAGILNYVNKASYYINEVKNERWSATSDFCFYDHTIEELFGKTLGIIGYGNIGRQVARIGVAFGMKVFVNSRSIPEKPDEGIEFVERDVLFSQADYISLHCPLTPQTVELINHKSLLQMKPDVIIINTGRGPLINENDLLTALEKNIIKGAILDVLQLEPPSQNHSLIHHPKCLVTPHIAWASKEARQRLLDGIVANIRSWQSGVWINRVE